MKTNRIILDHGSGGEAARQFINEILIKQLNNDLLCKLDDSAEVELAGP